MKKSRNWFYAMEITLAVIICSLSIVMIRQKSKDDYRKIAVIVRNADSNEWAAFRYGLKMAAQDSNLELSIVSTEDAMTQEEETDTIKSEIDNGADAVIVQPVAGDQIENELVKLKKKVPVMLVKYTASKEKEKSLLPSVEPDYKEMGITLAEQLCIDYNRNLRGKTYGIVTEQNETEAVKNCKEGLVQILEGAGAQNGWFVTESNGKSEENLLEKQPKVDIVIALDNKSLIASAECAASNNLHGALVYGIGNSTEAAYYLDAGIVECLIVPDEFDTGYQSLTEIAKSLENYFYHMKSNTVSHTVIRRKELFEKKNQEILFTMSQ